MLVFRNSYRARYHITSYPSSLRGLSKKPNNRVGLIAIGRTHVTRHVRFRDSNQGSQM